MGLFDRLKKSFEPPATANIATIATDEGGPVAIVAKVAVATPPNEKPKIPPEPESLAADPTLKNRLPERVAWESPLFGRLEGGPVLEMSDTTFSLVHPLTGEKVVLSREWLVSMEERAAIMEHDGGMSREEADRQAKIEFFRLFQKGGKP